MALVKPTTPIGKLDNKRTQQEVDRINRELSQIKSDVKTLKDTPISTGNGAGDVTGPATNTANYIPQWDGADSKKLKNGVPVSNFQAVLVSGTNIKTVNSTSLLGSGDIVISGGGGVGLFDIDINGDLEPVTTNLTDDYYELDGSDNIQPKAV